MPNKKSSKSAQEQFARVQTSLDELNQRLQLEDKMSALRGELERQKDDAHLALAAELLCMKSRNSWYWCDIPGALDIPCDYTLLCKVAKRQVYLSRAMHTIVCAAINDWRSDRNLSPIAFPSWVEWRDIG